MICVKVDKAPHSASSRRSQCPSARRPPTLRNSYITITSCTYHKIRSRASDLERSSSRTSSLNTRSSPFIHPSSVTDTDSATSTKCSIIHANRSVQRRRRRRLNDDDVSKATSRLDDFQFIYTKRGRPSDVRNSSSPSFIWYHSSLARPWLTRPPPCLRPWARGPTRGTTPRAPPCWIRPPASPRRLGRKSIWLISCHLQKRRCICIQCKLPTTTLKSQAFFLNTNYTLKVKLVEMH